MDYRKTLAGWLCPARLSSTPGLLTSGRTTRSGVLVLCICMAFVNSSVTNAQVIVSGGSGKDWTVLTIDRGSWGAATAPVINEAIAGAIARCRTASKRKLGCGANVVSLQSGWAVGLDCAGYSVLATGLTRSAAVEQADKKIEKLRTQYSAHLESCKVVVAVEATDGGHSSVAQGSNSPFEASQQRAR